MHTRVTIKVEKFAGLSGRDYTYILLDDKTFILDEYIEWSKKSLRHKMTIDDMWSRLYSSKCTIPKPIVPADVRMKVIRTYAATLTVED